MNEEEVQKVKNLRFSFCPFLKDLAVTSFTSSSSSSLKNPKSVTQIKSKQNKCENKTKVKSKQINKANGWREK